MADVPFLGSKISLISKCDIRYEGILYCVDAKESTIALSKVKSYGTEDRADPNSGSWVGPKNEVYDIIIFRASDVKDLRVDTPEPPGLSDPAIISAQQHAYPSRGPASSAGTLIPPAPSSSSTNVNHSTSSSTNVNNKSNQQQQHQQHSANAVSSKQSSAAAMAAGARIASKQVLDAYRSPTNNISSGPASKQHQQQQQQKPSVPSLPTGQNHQLNHRKGSRDRRRPSSNQRASRGYDRGSNHVSNSRSGHNDRGSNHVSNSRSGPNDRRYNDDRRHDVRRGGPNNSSNRGYRKPNDGRPPYRRGPMQGNRRPRSGDRGPGQGYRGPRKSAPLKFDGEYDFDKANKKFLELETKLKNLKLKNDDQSKDGDKLSTEEINSKSPAGDSESGSGYDTEDHTHKNEDSNDEAIGGEFYDKTKSFFDTISCEASERSQGKVGKPDWRKERQLNAETFGVSANYRRGMGYRPRTWQTNSARN